LQTGASTLCSGPCVCGALSTPEQRERTSGSRVFRRWLRKALSARAAAAAMGPTPPARCTAWWRRSRSSCRRCRAGDSRSKSRAGWKSLKPMAARRGRTRPHHKSPRQKFDGAPSAARSALTPARHERGQAGEQEPHCHTLTHTAGMRGYRTALLLHARSATGVSLRSAEERLLFCEATG
jgi:hypothetical protein